MVESSIIGLSIVILAWMIQAAYSWRGKKEVQKSFIIIYILGISLSMIDAYINDLLDVAFFNVIILVLTCLVFIRTGVKSESIAKNTKTKKKR
jgi:CDP-diglyceride synthetase